MKKDNNYRTRSSLCLPLLRILDRSLARGHSWTRVRRFSVRAEERPKHVLLTCVNVSVVVEFVTSLIREQGSSGSGFLGTYGTTTNRKKLLQYLVRANDVCTRKALTGEMTLVVFSSPSLPSYPFPPYLCSLGGFRHHNCLSSTLFVQNKWKGVVTGGGLIAFGLSVFFYYTAWVFIVVSTDSNNAFPFVFFYFDDSDVICLIFLPLLVGKKKNTPFPPQKAVYL